MKKFLNDFKAFIMTGNVLLLAVAFILGGATKAVVDSFVKNIVQPIIGAIVGKPTFANVLKIGKGRISYGAFITDVINLVIIGLVLFLIVKAYEKYQKNKPADAPSDEVVLLTEIRDALRTR